MARRRPDRQGVIAHRVRSYKGATPGGVAVHLFFGPIIMII
jgi:hypothetical protein